MSTNEIITYLQERFESISYDKNLKTIVLNDVLYGTSEYKQLREDISNHFDTEIRTITVPMIKEAVRMIQKLHQKDHPTEEWMKGMDITEKGGIVDSSLNNMILFDQHPDFAGKLYYDEVTKHEMYNGIELNDINFARLKTDVERALGGNRIITNVKTAALSYCMTHRKNLLKDTLLALRGKWDGLERLETLFIKAYDCDDTPYIRYATKVMFYAWLNRIMNPGCMFDSMFIFEGAQGIGKSKFLLKMINLIGGRGTENMQFNFDRNNLDKFSTYQLCQSEELKDMKVTDLSTIKDLISRTSDTFDRKFRDITTYQRTCILVGNVNPEEKNFLRDLVDYERRFIIFPCHAEGYPYGVRANSSWWDENFPDEYLMQVWAEAVYLVENEKDFRWISLPNEIARELMSIQAGYKSMQDDDVFLVKLENTLNLRFSKTEIMDYDDLIKEIENSKNPLNNKRLVKIGTGIWRRYVKDVLKENRSVNYFNKAMELIGWECFHTTTIVDSKRVNIRQYRRKESQLNLPL